MVPAKATRRWIRVRGCVGFVFGDSCGIVKWVDGSVRSAGRSLLLLPTRRLLVFVALKFVSLARVHATRDATDQNTD